MLTLVLLRLLELPKELLLASVVAADPPRLLQGLMLASVAVAGPL